MSSTELIRLNRFEFRFSSQRRTEMEKLVTFTIEMLLLPPGIIFVLLLLGILLLNKRRRIGLALLWLGIAGSYFFGTQLFSVALIQSLETTSSLPPTGPFAAQEDSAIVVLGGGSYPDAPEYGGDTVGAQLLERVRYAAELARRSRLPVLTTGGIAKEEHKSDAELMKTVMEYDFNVPVTWVEDQSRTTWENAEQSKNILEPLGIRRIYLVTHAWHMKRAEYAFRYFGFEVIPAPTSFTRPSEIGFIFSLLWPDASAMKQSNLALHEIIGLFWYRLKTL